MFIQIRQFTAVIGYSDMSSKRHSEKFDTGLPPIHSCESEIYYYTRPNCISIETSLQITSQSNRIESSSYIWIKSILQKYISIEAKLHLNQIEPPKYISIKLNLRTTSQSNWTSELHLNQIEPPNYISIESNLRTTSESNWTSELLLNRIEPPNYFSIKLNLQITSESNWTSELHLNRIEPPN